MEFKYTKITMHLIRVVNGNHLIETLNWLALLHRKVYRLLKTLFDQVFHPSEYIHSVIVLYTNQYYRSSNKTKHMFKPHTCYCLIHLAGTSVHYERDACANYQKIKFS